jgi:integrase
VTLLREAETAAGVPYVPGRSFHGLRRAFVDGAAGLDMSTQALQQLGGWSDVRTPERVYRDRDLVQGRGEARDARARLRGEDA